MPDIPSGWKVVSPNEVPQGWKVVEPTTPKDPLYERYPQLEGVDLSSLSNKERHKLIAQGVPIPLSGPRMGALGQGQGLSLSDEVGAAGAFIGESLKGAAQFVTGNEVTAKPLQTAKDVMALDKLQREQFREAHPGQSIALNVLGGFGSSGASLAGNVINAGKTGGVGLAMKEGAKGGAVVGGLSGVGASDGDVGDRAVSGAVGAGIGAGLGAVLPYAGEKVAQFFRARAVAESPTRASVAAYKQLRNTLAKDVGSKAKADQMLSKWAAAGGNADELVDMGGKNMEFLIRNTASDDPNKALGLINRFRENQADDIRGALSRSVSKKVGQAADVFDDIQFIKSTKSGPLYDAAYAQEVPTDVYQKELRTFVQRQAGKPAINNALKLATREGDFETAQMLSLAKDGKESTLSVKALDYIKRGVDDIVGPEIQGSKRQLGSALNNSKKQWLQTIDDVVPEYKIARDFYAGQLDTENALALGKDFVKMHPSQITRELKSMNPSEREFFNVGVAQALDDVISKTGDNANKARFVGNEMMRNRIKALIGDDPQAADEFISFLEKSSERYVRRTRISPDFGSQTELRQRSASKIAKEVGGIVRSPLGAAFKGVETVSDMADRRVSQELIEAFFVGKPLTPLPPALPGTPAASLPEALIPGALVAGGE